MPNQIHIPVSLYFHCNDRKNCSAIQEQSAANANEKAVQEAKNPTTSDGSVQEGRRCSGMLSNIQFYVKGAFMLVACVVSKSN